MSTKFDKSLMTAALAALMFSGTQAVAETQVTAVTATKAAGPVRALPHHDSEISSREAALIRHTIKDHKQLKRMAMADGTITRREQARLNYDAAKARALIKRAKNN